MRSALALCLALLPLTALAQTPQPWTPPFDVEVHDLATAPNGVDYRLFVRKPIVPLTEGERPITIYVLDALWDLPAVAALHSNLEFLGHFKPILFVGVGYRNETTERLEANRTRDYTPTAFRPADPKSHFLKPVDYEGSGGADAYLDVLATQIIPFVESTYDVDPQVRGIVGKSLGGLFATHALLTRPELFSHFLIISPALWWDDYFEDFRDRAVMEIERNTRTPLASDTKAYFTMGDGEERLGMLADVYVLTRALRLRNDPRLDLKVRLMDGEDHEGAFARGFGSGVRWLFEQR